MEFKGFIISYWEAIDEITSPPGENYNYGISAPIDARINMVVVPFTFQTYIDELTVLINLSAISMRRVDDCCYEGSKSQICRWIV